MKYRLLASLACLLLVACGGSGPVPTTSPGPGSSVPPTLGLPPTESPGAQPSTSDTAAPTSSSTPGVGPTDPAGSWTARADVARGPSAREDHTWTVDDAGEVAYLFGGRNSDGPSNELWAFDLVTDEWTQLQPSGEQPAPRLGHTATWVPGVGLVVWSGQGRNFFDDIWAYDPLIDAWRQLPSLGAVPEARYGSCASLGPDGRLWISHGFTQDDGRFADTRAYDFTTGEWADMTPAGDVPVKRCLHDCYWSDAGRLILYGGQTTGVRALGDIWSFDPGQALWTRGPDSSAAPRQLYAVAPAGAGYALVFGGGSLDSGFLDDQAWIRSDTPEVLGGISSGGPPARSAATLVADFSGDRHLLFGGKNETGLLDDLWEFHAGELPPS